MGVPPVWVGETHRVAATASRQSDEQATQIIHPSNPRIGSYGGSREDDPHPRRRTLLTNLGRGRLQTESVSLLLIREDPITTRPHRLFRPCALLPL
jgi:hypothetical protein